MNQYENLDGLIVERLKRNGAETFAELSSGDIHAECDVIAKTQVRGDDFRVLDRRLQALRKSGAIVFDRAVGWRVI